MKSTPGCNLHGLTANHSKTKLLTITRSRCTIPVSIEVNNHQISPCDTVKYLGVTINNDLKMGMSHQKYLQEGQTTSWLHPSQVPSITTSIRNQIYRTAVLPKLDYCGAVSGDPHHHSDVENWKAFKNLQGK